MTIEINGETVDVDAPLTLAALVEQRTGRAAPLGVAVARNGAIVPRSQWADERIHDGDAIELVGVMQGG